MEIGLSTVIVDFELKNIGSVLLNINKKTCSHIFNNNTNCSKVYAPLYI